MYTLYPGESPAQVTGKVPDETTDSWSLDTKNDVTTAAKDGEKKKEEAFDMIENIVVVIINDALDIANHDMLELVNIDAELTPFDIEPGICIKLGYDKGGDTALITRDISKEEVDELKDIVIS